MNGNGDNVGDVQKPEGYEARSKTSVPDLNLRRRRFVRGVTVVAPLVLTLRSGAVVAAVSCVGAKVVGATTGSSGKISYGGSAAVGDSCVTNYQVCPGQSTKILSGTNAGTVTANGGNLFCSGVNNQTVAILSSMSVTSLIALR